MSLAQAVAGWRTDYNAHNVITSTVSDSVLWTVAEQHFPAAAWPYLRDGKHLRASLDAEGTVELYRDQIRLDAVAETGRLNVLAPSVSSSAATPIYWWLCEGTAPSAAFEQNTYPSSIKLWCPLEDATGATATDRTQYGNDGTLANMEEADWVSGAGGHGYGLQMDGSDEAVSFGDSAALDIPNALTFGFALYRSGNPAGWESYFSKRNDGLNPRANWLANQKGTRFQIGYSDGLNFRVDSFTCGAEQWPDWHWVVGVLEQDGTSTVLSFYWDGELVAGPTTLAGNVAANSASAYLGRKGDTRASYAAATFDMPFVCDCAWGADEAALQHLMSSDPTWATAGALETATQKFIHIPHKTSALRLM